MKKILAHPHFIPWFLFIFFTTIYFSTTVGTMNSVDAPQYALTRALVENKTTRIDEFADWSYPDYVVKGGHKYSAREPGQSFIAVPFYIIAQNIKSWARKHYDGNFEGIKNESSVEAITYGSFSIFAALAVIVLYKICLHLTHSKKASLFTAIIFGLGSLLWKYSAGFVRQPLLSLLYLTFVYLMIQKDNKKTFRWILVGIFTGVMATVDNLSFIPFLIVGLFSLLLTSSSFKEKAKITLIYSTSVFIALSPLLVYNKITFGDYLKDGRQYHISSIKDTFIADSFKTLPILLFSSKPIPTPVFEYFPKLSQKIRNDFEDGVWATRIKFLGIFSLSPILFFGLIGYLFLFKRNPFMFLLILVVFISYLIPVSKLPYFYNPTSYDTRYLLPVTALLFIPLSLWFDYIFKKKRFFEKVVFWVPTAIFVLISLYEGWYALITHFAPHVSGEHRFSFSQLAYPFFAYGNFRNNAWLLFINTFPNIYNIHILFLFYIFPFLGIYFLHKYFKYLLTRSSK